MLLRLAAGAASLLCLTFTSALAGPAVDAARAGDLAALTQLLADADALNERDATGETPLIAASLAGNTEIVVELIKRGADVQVRNDRGLTALHAAAFSGDLPSVEALVAAGIVVDDADNKFKVTPLFVSAEENRIEVFKYLLVQGADISLTERHGYNVLSRAGFKGRSDVIAILLEKGAVCQELDPFWFKDCSKLKAEMGL
jgi:ankyrin repeat protein